MANKSKEFSQSIKAAHSAAAAAPMSKTAWDAELLHIEASQEREVSERNSMWLRAVEAANGRRF